MDSQAQLVLDREVIAGRPINVIRVRKHRNRPYGLLDVETRLEKEVRINYYLNDRQRNRVGPPPNIAELVWAHDLRPANTAVWTRASFWKYYNNGDMNKFLAMYAARAAPAERQPPSPIIARFIYQMLSTVQWLMAQGVIHGDLCFRNIFVHWEDGEEMPDFVIGNFGQAAILTDIPAAPTLDEWQRMSPNSQAQWSQPPDPRVYSGVLTRLRAGARRRWDIDTFLVELLGNVRRAVPQVIPVNADSIDERAPQTTRAVITTLHGLNTQNIIDSALPPLRALRGVACGRLRGRRGATWRRVRGRRRGMRRRRRRRMWLIRVMSCGRWISSSRSARRIASWTSRWMGRVLIWRLRISGVRWIFVIRIRRWALRGMGTGMGMGLVGPSYWTTTTTTSTRTGSTGAAVGGRLSGRPGGRAPGCVL